MILRGTVFLAGKGTAKDGYGIISSKTTIHFKPIPNDIQVLIDRIDKLSVETSRISNELRQSMGPKGGVILNNIV